MDDAARIPQNSEEAAANKALGAVTKFKGKAVLTCACSVLNWAKARPPRPVDNRSLIGSCQHYRVTSMQAYLYGNCD